MKAKIASLALLLSSVSILSTAPTRAGLAESEYARGVACYRQKQYSEALGHLQSALKTASSKADIRYYIALCYQDSGRHEQALEEYRYILKAFPHTTAAKRAAQIIAQLTPDSVRAKAARVTRPTRILTNSTTNSNRDSSLPVVSAPLTNKTETVTAPSPSSGDESYTVSFQKDSDSGFIYLPGKINGQAVSMLFDTGAGITTCTESFLNKTGIKVSRLGGQQVIAGVGGEMAAHRAVAKISVGSLTREIPLLITYNDQSLETRPILGQTFFRDLVYKIDGKNKKITFTFTDPAPRTSRALAREIPFTTDGDNIIVNARLNERTTEMVLDTGAELVTFADRHLAHYGFNRPTEAQSSDSRRVIGGRLREYTFTLDSLKVGPVKKESVRATVMINSKIARPLLGQSFLADQVYTVDPIRRIVRFE